MYSRTLANKRADAQTAQDKQAKSLDGKTASGSEQVAGAELPVLPSNQVIPLKSLSRGDSLVCARAFTRL